VYGTRACLPTSDRSGLRPSSSATTTECRLPRCSHRRGTKLALFSGRRAQNKLMQQLAAVVRDHFASPVNTISSA
jgi:hypothetical protein